MTVATVPFCVILNYFQRDGYASLFDVFRKKKNVYQLWNLGRIPILNRAGLTRRDTGTLSGGLVSARAAGKTRKYTEMTVRLFSILFFGCYSVRNNIRDECNFYVRRNIYG